MPLSGGHGSRRARADAYAYVFARGEGAAEAGNFDGPLRWLDFGSGQERGIRGAARERYFQNQAAQEAATPEEREVAAAGSPDAN